MLLKSTPNRIQFLLGLNPIIQKRKDWRMLIPRPYKSIAIISADFELAWASRYSKHYTNPLTKALEKATTERENIPRIVNLCEIYNIPITWLTVGHLFLEECRRVDGILHPEIQQPVKFENDWWLFKSADWFEYDPGTDFKSDPLWYCPDLVRMILKSNVKHEIGCHTFSHIDCRDNICTPEQFKKKFMLA